MDPAQIRIANRRRPFIPFRLHISDGTFYDVKHPDGIMITRRTTYVGVPGEADMAELAMMIDTLHITRVEDLPSTGAPANGAAS